MVVGAKSDLNENPLAWPHRWGVGGGVAIVYKTLDRRIRRAWFLFSLSVFLHVVGDVVAFYEDIILQLGVPYFISDIFYLAFYPFVLWALLTLPGVSLDRSGWMRFGMPRIFSIASFVKFAYS